MQMIARYNTIAYHCEVFQLHKLTGVRFFLQLHSLSSYLHVRTII